MSPYACDCAWTRAAADASVDGELAPDQVSELERALAQCDACRAYLDGLVQYKALVATVPAPPIPAALVGRLSLSALERRARELAPPTPRAVHAARAAGGVAATLIAWVALSTWANHPTPRTGSLAHEVSRKGGDPGRPVPPATPRPTPLALLEAYGQAVELAESGATIEAFARFERIRADAGTGELAAKAHYWTARLAPFPAEAIARADALARDHAASPFAPSALAHAAATCDGLGRAEEARDRRIDLVARYPASAEAPDAALALVRIGPGELRARYLSWLREHAPDSPQAAETLREVGGEGSDG